MNEAYRDMGADLGLYLLKEDEIPLAADCNAEAYEGYRLYDILLKNNCTPQRVHRIWNVTLKMLKNTALVVADGPKVNGMAMFMPPGYSGLSTWPFIRAGGFRLPMSVCRSLANYQAYCGRLREKHTKYNCWYLLDLAIRPSAYTQELGIRLVQPILERIRNDGYGCFVETQEEMEVGFFEHLGFEVVETGRIPGTDEPIFAMYWQ